MIKKLVSLLLTATMLVVHVPNVYAENEGFDDLGNQSSVIESKTEENIDIEDFQNASEEEVNQEIKEEINAAPKEEVYEIYSPKEDIMPVNEPIVDSFITDEEMDEFRKLFYKTTDGKNYSSNYVPNDSQDFVITENSNIIHVPQISPKELIPLKEGEIIPRNIHIDDFYGYSLNDTRDFYIQKSSDYYVKVKAKNIAVSENVNIWLVDDADYHLKMSDYHNSNCTINLITSEMANTIATTFNKSYKLMTDPVTGFGKHELIQGAYSNVPWLGDIDEDGKVNILLYDIGNNGTNTTGSFVAGFFTNGDYMTDWEVSNMLDLFHIDIGKNQGYKLLTENNSRNFYGTLSHELQHMLFFEHCGGRKGGDAFARQSTWFNEALSGYADVFYVDENTASCSPDRLLLGVNNSYGQETYGNENRIGDMFNFNNSIKNYGMGYMFSIFTKNKFGRGVFPNEIYKKFDNTSDFNQTNFRNSIGDVVKSLSIGTNLSSEKAFQAFYYMFMETFGADGGNITYNGNTYKTDKLIQSNITADSEYRDLWNTRKANSVNYPAISTDEEVLADYYNKTPGLNDASLDKLYRLSGSGEYLNIYINSALANTKYYVAIPDSNSEKGAELIELNKLEYNSIKTDNKEVYLFISTYYQSVRNNILYTWSDSEIQENSEFMVSPGTKAQTIRITLLNTDNEIYNSGQLEYTLTKDINNKSYTKWKPFKKNKVDYIDNIKTTGEMSLYYRTKPTKENKNPEPVFIKKILNVDIQLLAKPSGNIKSAATGFYELTNLTFGNAYPQHEYAVSYDENTAFWKDCPLIVTSKRLDLALNYIPYNDGESLLLRKKATTVLPHSVAKKIEIIGSSAPPMSTVNVTPLSYKSFYFDIDFAGGEDLSSKFQYAIINYDNLFKDPSKTILKATWQSVKNEEFLVTRNLKRGNYLFAIRFAKNGKKQASEPVFADIGISLSSIVPGNDSTENTTELSIMPLTVDMSEVLSEFTKSN